MPPTPTPPHSDQTVRDVQRFLNSPEFRSAEIEAEPADVRIGGQPFKQWAATHAAHGYQMREFNTNRPDSIVEIKRLITEALAKRSNGA